MTAQFPGLVHFNKQKGVFLVNTLLIRLCAFFILIWRGFAPGFVNYKKGCTRLAAASDKVYQLHAHGRWFSMGTPASSTTKTGGYDTVEILLKVALNTKNQSINQSIKLRIFPASILAFQEIAYSSQHQFSFCRVILMLSAV
jgi:hypothetical protein